MSNNLDKFDSNLKDILENYKPEYSTSAWGRLSKDLPKNYAKWYYIAASIVLAVVSLLTYNILENSNNNTELISDVHNPQTEIFTTESRLNTITLEESQQSNDKEITSNKEQLSNVGVLKSEEIEPSLVEELIVEGQVASENPEERVCEHLPINNILEGKKTISSEILVNTNVGCEPLDVDFSISDLPKGAKVEWFCEGRSLSNAEKFDYTFNKKGKYTVKLNISTSTEIFSVEEEIIVKETPIADFSYNENDGLLELENLSKVYETIQWTFPGVKTDEENPNFEMLYSGDYLVSLLAVNENGCRDIKEVVVAYKVDHHIFAPNAFSPNGDGANDEFVVKYEPKEGYIYTLQIYDSSGKKLFETQDRNDGWDGKNAISNSNSNYEKFLWRLIIQDPRGEKEVKEDSFQILSR